MTETATHGKTLATSEAIDVQKMLHDREMRFTRALIDLDEIDADASTRNQARLLAVHQDVVEIYRAAMEAGDRFPPIVLNATHKPYVVLDGNHRLFAARMAGITSFEAFLVTSATKAQMELFTYEANARHGLPTTIAERVKQGLYLVSLGNTAAIVARSLGVPERRLWEALQLDRVERRMTKLGIDHTRLSGNNKRRLSNLRSDVVLAPAAELAIRVPLGSDDISQLVTDINRQATEAEQLAVVAGLRTRLQPVIASTAGGRIELPKDVVRLRMAAKLLRNIDATGLESALDQIAVEFRSLLARDVVESVSTLLTASKLLKDHA